LMGKPEGKRPLGRPTRRRVDNIRMNLQKVGCELDWDGLRKGLVVNACECGNELSGSIKCVEFHD
jgi:hypothetical protein